MPNKFLLSCECGRSVAVELSQAGQQVPCPCGKKIVVPSLRAIRQLPPATEQSGKPKSRTATWNPVKGLLFAIGALLAIGGLVTAAYSYSIYYQASAFQPSASDYEESLVIIGNMTPLEVLDAWHQVKEHGLEPAGSSPFAMAKEVADEKRQNIVIALAVAMAGLICALTPVVLRGKN